MMGRPRKDKMCVTMHLCVSNEVNELIERYQAEVRLKQHRKLLKAAAAAELFEKLAIDNGMIATA